MKVYIYNSVSLIFKTLYEIMGKFLQRWKILLYNVATESYKC